MNWKEYPRYRASKIEWLDELPATWESTKLAFHATIKARLGWKGLKAEEYVEKGFIFLSTPNIKNGKIDFSNVNYISADRYYESPEIELKEGDILLAKDGSTLGITNRVQKLPEPATVNSSIAVIRPEKTLNSDYLYWLLSSHYIQSLIQKIKAGQGVPHLFQGDLRKFPIWLPTLKEQGEIAFFLDSETARIDTIIEKKQRQIELLQEKRAALIIHAVTKGLNPKLKMKDSGVEWLGEIPEHWEVIPIKRVAQMESGHTPDKKIEAYWTDCNIPWVSLNDTTHLKAHDYIDDTVYHVNELGLANSSARLLPARVVVFTRDASIGLSAITTRPMAVSQHIIAWLCGPRISPEYLLYVFYSMTQELERLCMGTTIRTIGMPDVLKIITPLPPFKEQEQITCILSEEIPKIVALVGKIQESIRVLKEYRSAMISAAVTGKIDVRKVS